MKIYMHWDMEGASGIFTREQVWYWEEGVPEHVAEEGRQLLIADVNAAVQAALDAGVDEVIVSDTHHGGGNIRLDDMFADPRITYHDRSVGYQDGERRWMPGLDETVDGLMLPGHHAKVGTAGAFLPHTWTGQWADFLINGQSVGEIGIEACFASHWDIPLILVQGDTAGCREAEQQFPGVITAEVKHAEDHDSCSGLDPESARLLTGQKVTEAIAKLRAGGFEPIKPTLPMTVTIRMKSVADASAACQRPGVTRLDDYTVEGVVSQQCDVVKWILGTGLDMPEPTVAR
ncbi:MAG: M55 family metallopeptidase [Candidatus Poribacteria bacterium]|nr:M55 family metallopeptidase [Candidatus Poribacteria bacterium]